jgi:hypothetical protein
VDFGEQGILQRREAGAGNDQSAGTGGHCDVGTTTGLMMNRPARMSASESKRPCD